MSNHSRIDRQPELSSCLHILPNEAEKTTTYDEGGWGVTYNTKKRDLETCTGYGHTAQTVTSGMVGE